MVSALEQRLDARRRWTARFLPAGVTVGAGPLGSFPDPFGLGQQLGQLPGVPGGVPAVPGAPMSFSWRAADGERLLVAFGTPGTQIMTADDFRQGLVTALFHAEELAVQAGLSVAIPSPQGPGLMLGAGEAKARALVASGQATDPRVGRYLAVLDAVKAALDASHEAPPDAQVTIGGNVPVALSIGVVLLVVGLAAIVAAAYAAVEMKKVEVTEGPLARVRAAKEALTLGVPPELVPPVVNPPKGEDGGGIGIGGALLGAAVVLGGVYVLTRKAAA